MSACSIFSTLSYCFDGSGELNPRCEWFLLRRRNMESKDVIHYPTGLRLPSYPSGSAGAFAVDAVDWLFQIAGAGGAERRERFRHLVAIVGETVDKRCNLFLKAR